MSLSFFQKLIFTVAHAECKTHPVYYIVSIIVASWRSLALEHSMMMVPLSQSAIEAFLLKTNVQSETCRS